MAEGKKKLYRSRDERWLVGVCGGIGEYFDIDATVIRVIFVLATFLLGGGLWIYIILWIIMPLTPDEFLTVEKPAEVEELPEETPADEAE
jgi:phage shock protein PspC (stress-responsive transcriptional regulator)